jgi:thioredoxin reductase
MTEPLLSSPTEPHEMDWQVLVVGRSYAGLAAALTLGRSRRATLVVGDGPPRNDSVTATHGVLGHDGVSPDELLRVAERQLEPYETVHLLSERVHGLDLIEGGVRARVGSGTVTAERVILATGVNDDPAGIPGLADHWGHGVYTCPYCDGWEHRDGRLAAVVEPAFAAHVAALLSMWSDDVTVFSTGLDDTGREAVAAHGARLDERPVLRVRGDGDRVHSLELEDDTVVPVDAVFAPAMPRANHTLAADLGCDLDELGYVVVGPDQATSVERIYAVGDVTSLRQFSMTHAAAQGVTAAVSLNAAALGMSLPTPSTPAPATR